MQAPNCISIETKPAMLQRSVCVSLPDGICAPGLNLPAGTNCVSAETKLAMLRRKMEGGGRAALEDLRRQEQELLSVAQIEARRAAAAGWTVACLAQRSRLPPHAPPGCQQPENLPGLSFWSSPLQKMAKRCPKCGMATQKSEGCNKMSCGGCGAYWCGPPLGLGGLGPQREG